MKTPPSGALGENSASASRTLRPAFLVEQNSVRKPYTFRPVAGKAALRAI